MRKLVIFIFVVGILGSCATRRSVTPEVLRNSSLNEKKIFYDNVLKKSDFDALKITSRIDVQNGKSIPTINAIIYIENQRKVWMNMTALFLNIGRGLVTPQGLKAYERIDKTYIDSNFSYLNELLNVNFLDYNAFQNLLVGKIFFPIDEKDFSLTKSIDGYLLKSKDIHKMTVDRKSSEYLIDFQFSSTFDLVQVQLKDPKSTHELKLFYENWFSINGQRFPRNVKIVIKGKKTDHILIENTKFEFSKMDTPYSVPDNYKKRDL